MNYSGWSTLSVNSLQPALERLSLVGSRLDTLSRITMYSIDTAANHIPVNFTELDANYRGPAMISTPSDDALPVRQVGERSCDLGCVHRTAVPDRRSPPAPRARDDFMWLCNALESGDHPDASTTRRGGRRGTRHVGRWDRNRGRTDGNGTAARARIRK